MPRGQMKSLTKESFVTEARDEVESVRKGGRILSDLATLLERAPDFSSALLAEVRAAREKLDSMRDELKALEEVLVLRGRTFAHEQFDETLAVLKGKAA